MNRTVHATDNADHFHMTRNCSAFHSAQLLSDTDCGCDTYCTHRMPRMWPLREMTMAEALGKGKWPCTACYPSSAAALMIAPCEEDFGHEPVEYDGYVFCRRCEIPDGPHILHTVPWPCTSAIVLGLVSRDLVTED